MGRNKNSAIFLDRDGTIIEDGGYLKDPSDVLFFPETFKALQRLQDYFLLFIVTNQAGIAEGKISCSDANRVNSGIVTALAEGGVEVTDVYVCPHRRSDNCHCIKPKPYFLKRAATLYGLDLNKSFTVGDHPHDIQLAKNVGARGIYVFTGHGEKHLAELPQDTEVVTGIMEAAEKITSRYRVELPRRRRKQIRTGFTLNLMDACHLWWRSDLGREPQNAKRVAEVLREARIEVYKVQFGWLECEPRPVGIWEALTGRSAPPDWAKQFNCLPEQPGQVLKILADKGIPVQALGYIGC